MTFPTAIFSAGNLKFYPTFHAEDRATFWMRICGRYMSSILHILPEDSFQDMQKETGKVHVCFNFSTCTEQYIIVL